MKLNPHLKEFWQTESQVKVVYGGRMSGKTYDTCGFLSYVASRYKLRVACLRRFQNKLSESVFSTFKTIITNDTAFNGYYKFTKNTMSSNIGSEFIFMGIERNLDDIKGLDNIDITFIEEAEKLTKEQWNIIKATVLRKQGSFIILVFNPNLDTDYIYDTFVKNKPANAIIKQLNYIDNPYLSASANELIRVEKLEMSEIDFNNIYMGIPKSEHELSLIKREWLYNCVDAHDKLGIKNDGAGFVGYDVADSGTDSNAIVARKGNVIYHIEEWQAEVNEMYKSSLRVHSFASKTDSMVIYDCIGVGAGVGSNIDNINTDKNIKVSHDKFNAGAGVQRPAAIYKGKVKNKDMFLNLKAQAWWCIADRIKYTSNAVNGLIDNIDPSQILSIDSKTLNIDRLIIELSTPMRDFDNSGRVKLESKKDMAKRGIKSPNLADAFIICVYNNIVNYDFMDML